MELVINGKKEEVNGVNMSVSKLLTVKEVEMPDMVSVELNGNILKRNTYETAMVKEGDTVEFLYFMGGGQYGSAKKSYEKYKKLKS